MTESSNTFQAPPDAPKIETVIQAPGNDSLDELKRLEAEVSGTIPGRKDTPSGDQADGEQVTPGKKKRRKFKSIDPTHTIRLTIRQYWRFRDWMARRQLGLPSEYAGVFLQQSDALVEPLVEPLIGCLDAYLPEEWVVLIEEKAPILSFMLALFECEQTFSSMVSNVKLEQQKQKTQAPINDGIRFPGLNETGGASR